MDPKDVAQILGSVGAGAIILKLIEAGLRAVTGSASRKRSEIDRIERARRAESVRADDEAAYRRIISEWASEQIRVAVDWGVPRDQFQPFPPRPTRPKE